MDAEKIKRKWQKLVDESRNIEITVDETATPIAGQACEHGDWIPVSERLPDEEMNVLICYHDVENAQDAICLGYVFENSTWHDDDGFEINSPDYWMPLPHPPAK